MFCELDDGMVGPGCLDQSTKVFVVYHQYPFTTVSSAEHAVVLESSLIYFPSPT